MIFCTFKNRVLPALLLALACCAVVSMPELHASTVSYSRANALEQILENQRAVVRIFALSDDHTSSGTGFIISEDGMIATNRHVTEGADTFVIYILSGNAQFARAYEARVHEQSNSYDLAILQLQGEVVDMPVPLKLTHSRPRVLDDVIALGFPSALDVSIPESVELGRAKITDPHVLENLQPNITKGAISKIGTWVVHDAKIGNGNSGGPLISLATGEVVGVNTAATQDGGVFFLAIPAEKLHRMLSLVQYDQARIPELMEKVKQYEPDAMLELALMIMKGETGDMFSIKEAIMLLEEAASLGELEAYTQLGNMFYDGEIVPRDALKAREYYIKGDIPSCWINLAEMYAFGDEGVKTDVKKAYHYAKKAAEQAHPWGVYQLAIFTKNGTGVRSSLNGAIDILERYIESKAANPKSISSDIKLALARMYAQRNEGEDWDGALLLAESITWSEYDHNKGAACEFLGSLYYYGDCMPVDLKKAMKYYKLGVDEGHADSMLNLARMYLMGQGVASDRRKAVSLIQQSLEIQESGAAYGLLARAYSEVGEKRQAVELNLKAARLGYGPSQLLMVIEYAKGQYIEKSQQKSDYWLKQALQAHEWPDIVKAAREIQQRQNTRKKRSNSSQKKPSTRLPQRASQPW